MIQRYWTTTTVWRTVECRCDVSPNLPLPPGIARVARPIVQQLQVLETYLFPIKNRDDHVPEDDEFKKKLS